MRTEELAKLIEQGKEHSFYTSVLWGRTRETVLKLDRYECQLCKAKGRYARAEIVHHVRHLKDRPDLALSIWDPETGDRQLLSVCKACHEREHPESLVQFEPKAQPMTAERWD